MNNMQILPNCALIPKCFETCMWEEAIDKTFQRNVSPTTRPLVEK